MRESGMRLRHARKARGMTQTDLAKASGVKQASISQLETGESKSFRGATLLSLARALNISPDWLSHGRGPMERRDVPLTDKAVAVAQAWQRLTPEMQDKIADMILTMAEQSDKFGTAVEDEKVERAYGRPPRVK
jgi:transcriptional regulator with XRE-family HTH domain